MSFLARIKYYKELFIHLFKIDKWSSESKFDVLLVRHDVDCGFVFKGQKYSQLLDSIRDELKLRNISCLSVATPLSTYYGQKAYGMVVSFNGAFSRILIIEKFKKILKIIGIKNFIINNKTQTDIWLDILSLTKAKAVISVQPDISLCNACHQMKIWLADMQHGVISEDVPFYSYKNQNLNSINNSPNCYLCWDTESGKIIKRWATEKGIDVKVIGNPWFIRFQEKKVSDEIVYKYDKEIKDYLTDKPTILVSLQWGMKKLIEKDNFCIFFSKDLQECIVKTSKLYNWVIRLHPVQQYNGEKKRIYKYLRNTFNDKIFENCSRFSTCPLPLLLPNIKLHITYSSNITTEAAWFGIPTALLDSDIGITGAGKDYFKDERAIGIAETIDDSVVAITKWIAEKIKCNKNYQRRLIDTKPYSEFIDFLADKVKG